MDLLIDNAQRVQGMGDLCETLLCAVIAGTLYAIAFFRGWLKPQP